MSSNHTSFTKLALLLVMVGALALAGCGGGGDNGLSAADQARLDQAGVDRMAAEQAEADKMAAEQQAGVDRMAAEQAEADKMAAEQQAGVDRMAAEQAEADKMAAEQQAEVDRMAAEQAEADAAAELAAVQMAATAAAAAAKMASAAAAADAMTAMNATANIATLQTDEMSKMMAYDAKKAADGAMKAYMAAKMASETAAAAMTTEAATEARVMADAAQMDAEKYAMTASEKSDGAVKYAAMELMINGTMKMVGDSSIDARMGMLTDTADDGSKTITGLQDTAPMHTTEAVDGVPYAVRDSESGKDTLYKQAVAEGVIKIGKTLDTTDDMARLTLITHYEGKKMVRVFADGPTTEVIDVTVGAAVVATEDDAEMGSALADDAIAKSVGLYYKAEHYEDAAATAVSLEDDTLLAFDRVTVTDAKGVDIFELSADGVADLVYARRVDSTTNAATGVTTHTYRVVDIMADAMSPDGPDLGDEADDLKVTTSIPAATAYSHLHFGVWANLGEADKKDGMQMLADLGIGFVQNISDFGITEKQGIGKAVFNGDWVGAVARAHGEGEGDIALADGKATLTADFGKDEFTGKLTGLVTLEGNLSGNGFSGMKATVGANDYGLTAGGTFAGMFEGGIYGPAGEEAGGIFDFSSTSDGAFRGAFGGARDDN